MNASVYDGIDIGYARDVSAIGKAIRERRKPLMTQGEFAERVGLSQPSVSAWERGESLPSAEHLPKIARVLECSVEDLVRGVDPKYDKQIRDRETKSVSVRRDESAHARNSYTVTQPDTPPVVHDQQHGRHPSGAARGATHADAAAGTDADRLSEPQSARDAEVFDQVTRHRQNITRELAAMLDASINEIRSVAVALRTGQLPPTPGAARPGHAGSAATVRSAGTRRKRA